MPGKPPGDIVLGIIEQLKEHGQLTRAELCAEMGAERLKVASVVSRMNKPTKLLPKRIYVAKYVMEDSISTKEYPRAQYALGDLPDAEKPKSGTKARRRAISKKYRDSRKVRVNSVFQLAKTRRERDQERRDHYACVQEEESVGATPARP